MVWLWAVLILLAAGSAVAFSFSGDEQPPTKKGAVQVAEAARADLVIGQRLNDEAHRVSPKTTPKPIQAEATKDGLATSPTMAEAVVATPPTNSDKPATIDPQAATEQVADLEAANPTAADAVDDIATEVAEETPKPAAATKASRSKMRRRARPRQRRVPTPQTPAGVAKGTAATSAAETMDNDDVPPATEGPTGNSLKDPIQVAGQAGTSDIALEGSKPKQDHGVKSKEAAAKPHTPDLAPTVAPAVAPVVAPPKPAMAAKIAIENLKMHGSLAARDVRRALGSKADDVTACYRRAALNAGHDLAGAVNVELTIDYDGRARNVVVGGFGLTGVSACLKGHYSRVRTRERPDTGTVGVTFKLRYSPYPPTL